jgi:ABC-2 type transport system permease protein
VYTPSVNPTTSCTISLEGKKLWIYKSIPTETKDILKAKTAVNIIVNLPFILIADLLMCIKFELSIFDYLLLIVLGATFILLFSLTGIMINLANPKLDFETRLWSSSRAKAL